MSACSSEFYMRTFRWILGSIGFLIIAGCANEIEKQNNLDSGHLLTVAQLSEDETHKLLLSGIIENTDRYSRYLPPRAAGHSRESRDGFGGIGVVLDQVNGRVIIHNVTPHNPAAEAGLRENDQITHIDGKSILGHSVGRVVKLLRGVVSEPVQIRISREN